MNIDFMQIHELKPIYKSKKKKRVGRGGKKGTYSGRGMKGQKARAGRKLKPIIRDLIKRYPKLRGYRFKGEGQKPAVVNIGILEDKFEDKETVTPEILIVKKLISKIKREIPQVKILGKGKITKALTVEGCDVSKTAKEAIEKAGGKVVKP